MNFSQKMSDMHGLYTKHGRFYSKAIIRPKEIIITNKGMQRPRETSLTHLTHLKFPSRLRTDSTHHLTKHGIILGISFLEDIVGIEYRGILLNKENEPPVNTSRKKIF